MVSKKRDNNFFFLLLQIGPFGLTQKTLKRAWKVTYFVGFVAIVGIFWACRTSNEYTVITPLHLWLADVGILAHSDIGYLQTIGEVCQ